VGVAAKLAVSRRADGPAASTATVCAALLQGQELLGTEGLVVCLRCSLNEVLEVGSQEEITQVNELAVLLILNVDNTPPVLSTADLLTVDDDVLLRSHNGERDEALFRSAIHNSSNLVRETNLDLPIKSTLLLVKLLVVIGEHLEVVEGEFLLDALLELLTLLYCQGIGLGNDGHNIDDVRELLQHNNVNRLQRVSGGLDEEQAAVDTGILDITFALRCEFLPQVRGVLILDVLDDGVPAAVIVDQITIAGGIDNVESQTDAILLDDVGNGLDLGGLADRLIGLQSTLGVDQVRSKDGVDQSRLSKTSLAYVSDRR
jgi:hypothetical protein